VIALQKENPGKAQNSYFVFEFSFVNSPSFMSRHCQQTGSGPNAQLHFYLCRTQINADFFFFESAESAFSAFRKTDFGKESHIG